MSALGDNAAAVRVYERLIAMKTVTPDDIMIRLGRAARAVGQYRQGKRGLRARRLRIPVQRSRRAGQRRARESADADRWRLAQPLQARAGRAERLFGAKRYAGAAASSRGFARWRRATSASWSACASRSALLPQTRAQRRATACQAVHRERVAAGRGAVLLCGRRARTRRHGGVPPNRAPPRRPASGDQSMGRRSAEQPGDLLHPAKRRRRRRTRRSARCTRSFRPAATPERAAWKLGWWAYKNGRYADTVRAFESGAAHFPRSDYRPSWLYWSARAHEVAEGSDPGARRATRWSRPTT